MAGIYHWLGVIAYCLAMVCIGWRIRRRIAHDEGEQLNYEFWIAKRQLPGWRLAISLTAGWLMLGWLGFGMSQIYMFGATGLWILPIPWLILCVIIIFMVPYVRRLAAVSLPQGIQKRYGYSARVLLAVFSFFVFIAWTQAELFMGGKLMAPLLHAPEWLCMVVLVLPIILYVTMGGFRANVATDVAQFLIMAPFMIILAIVALQQAGAASGGNILQAIRDCAPPTAGKGQALNPWFLGWIFPVVLLVGYLPGWLIEQDLVIRVQAARSTREARKAAIWGLVLIGVFVIVLPSIIAFCSLVVYPPQADGTVNPALGANAYNICSAFIEKLPTWLSVFMLVGIVACQMSTVDTFANVSALALAYDLVEPVLQRQQTPARKRLLFAKGLSVLVLLLSLACAAISQSLQDVYYISSGVLSACIAVPSIFIFWRRTTLPAVLAAGITGFVGTIGGFLYEYHYLQTTDAKALHYYSDVLPAWLVNSYGYNYIAAGVILSLVSIVTVSLATGPATERQLASLAPAPVESYSDFVSQTSAPAGPDDDPLASRHD